MKKDKAILVMKFGGASVKDAPSIRRVADIISTFGDRPLLVVISAMGKTTNHLEKLAYLARDQKQDETLEQFNNIKDFHQQISRDLFKDETHPVFTEIDRFFVEIERIVRGILMLEEFPSATYDRIVSYGELLSTTIVAAWLREQGCDCTWLDARKLVHTDSNYKQAKVVWSTTEESIKTEVLPLLEEGKMAITQGFIGSSSSGKTTTLGREGSDFTAAIFAHCLEADSLVVWKDVPGVLNADPRLRTDTQKLANISYEEAIEMTFYGATVIHPKTIQPIFIKRIPLFVKSFLNREGEGTRISQAEDELKVPTFIRKPNQALVTIKPRDFAFMDEQLMQEVFAQVYKSGLKVNLVQQSAISLMLCVDSEENRLEYLSSLLTDLFRLEFTTDLNLHTVLHFRTIDLRMAADAVLVQQTGNRLSILRKD